MSSKNFNFVSSFQKAERENSFNSSLKQYHSGSMSVFKFKDCLISLILSFSLLLFVIVFPIENSLAVPSISYNITYNYAGDNYTIFSDAGNGSGPEIYKFEEDFTPVLDDSGNQIILLPTDPNYSNYILNAFRVLSRNFESISVISGQSFALLGFVDELPENSIAVWQINFGINELHSIYWTKLEKDDPFLNPNSGDIGYVSREDESIIGGKWTYNFEKSSYNWTGNLELSGNNAFRINFEQLESGGNSGTVAPSWKLKNCKGDTIAEDKGDGNLQPGSILVMVEEERVGDEITYRVRHYIPKADGGYNLDLVIYWFRGMFFWVPPWRP